MAVHWIGVGSRRRFTWLPRFREVAVYGAPTWNSARNGSRCILFLPLSTRSVGMMIWCSGMRTANRCRRGRRASAVGKRFLSCTRAASDRACSRILEESMSTRRQDSTIVRVREVSCSSRCFFDFVRKPSAFVMSFVCLLLSSFVRLSSVECI
jgi:hypothetical protein